MINSYLPGRRLWNYLGGASAARAGDEMSGPALLLLGLAVTGRPATGSELLASVTIAGAAGGPFFGALLDRSRRPERVLAATLAAYALGIGVIAAAAGVLPIPLVVVIALTAGLFNPAVAPGWLTVLAVAVGGAGEGPQLTALFAVRHRESPEHMRGQIFTTAASLKIGGMAAGAALAGPLAGRSVTGCLLMAAGIELCAAAAYLLMGRRPGRRSANLGPVFGRATASRRPAKRVAAADTPVRSEKWL